MPIIKSDDYLKKKSKELGLSSAVALMKARESAGLTQRELAELASVPQSTIARIEKGHNTSFDTLSKLASALNKELKVAVSYTHLTLPTKA